MDVLISGAGIAGPCLAWWLLRGGHRPVIVESAPALRTGGYIIDFWGKGYDLAERMGLLTELREVGYQVQEVRLVDADGEKVGGFEVDALRRITRGRFVSLPRSELSRVLFEAVRDDVEAVFGDSIAAIDNRRDGAEVHFEHAPPRHFDLVVGAEGIHSPSRGLTCGPQTWFERYLGYQFAAYTIPDYPQRDSDVYFAYSEPGWQAARFSLRDGSTLVLMVWRDRDGAPIPHNDGGKKALLRARFAGGGWEVPALLDGLDSTEDLYVDRVSQIRMEIWHKDRVALLGDAAFAPSFLAGQGSALAMIGAYVLAGELGCAQDNIERGLSAYEKRLKPFMDAKQKSALSFAGSFVPASRFGIAVRNLVTHFMQIGWVADLAFGRSVRDDIELPDYPIA